MIKRPKFGMFFDTPGMTKAVKNANTKALYYIGQTMRRSAMNLSRPNPKKVRPVGQPYRKGTDKLRHGIVFDVDEGAGDVTVGYFKYIKASEAHELGARIYNRGYRKWVTYKLHPTLVPGMEKAKPTISKKFPDLYKRYFEK